jgi:S-formylglutathione hydrolase FrmB
MKKFLAIYTGQRNSPRWREWDALSEADRKKRENEGMRAWMDWGRKQEASIVENGGPLGKTKRVTEAGIGDIKNAMAAYTVVEAETHEDAARLFEDHPHFTIFPGDGVEIMEVLPIPGA